MRYLRSLVVLVIATHGLVAVWHVLTTSVLVGIPHIALDSAIGLLAVAHSLALLAWRFLHQRAAGLFLLVLFLAALGFGSYEHFLSARPNNIFRMASGTGVIAFRASSVLLFLLEASGCWLGFPAARLPQTAEASA